MSSSPSSSATTSGSAANPASPSGTANYFTNLGLGYPIAIALGFLVVLSLLLLASYICCRASRASSHSSSSSSSLPSHSNPTHPHPHDGIILPRIIFVAEDDDDDGRRDLDDSAVVGLDQSVINSYPKFPYERDGSAAAVMKESTCSICLCEYKASEMLRMMPECRHCFHLCCLDAWLKLNGSCPVCRNSPLPTPLSTPLQEVVPLAQFAADRRRSR